VPGSLFRDARQPDTETYRYYEMTGVAHTTVHEDVEILPEGFLGLPRLTLEDACLNQPNTSADGPVFGSYLMNAMWANLDQQVRLGIDPPFADPMGLDAAGDIARDGFGNALGGIRLPVLEVPIATYTGNNVINPNVFPPLQGLLGLFCRLTGSVFDFDQATLATLYQNNSDYVGRVRASAKGLRKDGFLLQAAVTQIVADAQAAQIMGEDGGCGTGGGAALVILPAVWWRSRRALGRQRGGRS